MVINSPTNGPVVIFSKIQNISFRAPQTTPIWCHQYYYGPGLNVVTLQLVQLEHSDSIYLRAE